MKSLKHLFIGVAMIGLVSAMASKSFGSPGESKVPVLSEITAKSEIAIFNLVTPEIVTLSKAFVMEKIDFKTPLILNGCGRIALLNCLAENRFLFTIDSTGHDRSAFLTIKYQEPDLPNHYGDAAWHTLYKSGWLDIAKKIPEIKRSLFRNRF